MAHKGTPIGKGYMYKLRELRDRRAQLVSLAELIQSSRAVHMNKSYVSRILNNPKTNINDKTRQRIALVLKEHLKKTNKKAKTTSPHVVNNVIHVQPKSSDEANQVTLTFSDGSAIKGTPKEIAFIVNVLRKSDE